MIILSLLALCSPLISATCTNFTKPIFNDFDTGFPSNTFNEQLGWFACPSANTSCDFSQPNDHLTLTIHAKINISASTSDTSRVLSLASSAYRVHFNDSVVNSTFKDHDTVIYYANASTLLTTIGPGRNGSLTWQPRMMYVSGTLEGCDNSSLEGMVVTAAAPQLRNNGTDVQGGFEITTAKISSARKGMVDVGFGGGALGLLAVVGVVAMGMLTL